LKEGGWGELGRTTQVFPYKVHGERKIKSRKVWRRQSEDEKWRGRKKGIRRKGRRRKRRRRRRRKRRRRRRRKRRRRRRRRRIKMFAIIETIEEKIYANVMRGEEKGGRGGE
jgi:hypothetical protein